MSVINENSTTKEILSEIRYTFMEKEFEVYQGIVVQREDDLKAELKKTKEDNNSLEKKNCLFLLDKLELEKELKSSKIEIDFLKKKRFLSEAETHVYADQNMKKPKIETDELKKKRFLSEADTHVYADQNMKKPKIEPDEEALMELRNENKKLKEEIELYRKMFPDHLNRMTFIEAKLEDFLEKYPSNFRAENVVVDDDDHSHDISTCAKIWSSRNPTATQSSNLRKDGGETLTTDSREITPSIGLNLQNSASDLKNGIDEPLTKANLTEPTAVTVEVTTAAIDRDKLEVIVIESDGSDSDSDGVSVIN